MHYFVLLDLLIAKVVGEHLLEAVVAVFLNFLADNDVDIHNLDIHLAGLASINHDVPM